MLLTNTEIRFLYKWLDIPLHGEESRARNKFIALIKPVYNKAEEERVSCIESFADKDTAGKPIIDKGQYKLTDENRKKFEEAVKNIAETETEVEVPKLVGIPLISLLVDRVRDHGIEEGVIYDAVVTKFEALRTKKE